MQKWRLIYKKFQKRIKSNRGEAYVDTGVKVLIAVVLGALVLSGLYALFNTKVMPSVKSKVESMFEYSDGGSAIGEGLPEFEVLTHDEKVSSNGYYNFSFPLDAGNIETAYFDSKEIINGTDFSYGPGGNFEYFSFAFFDTFLKKVSPGEHSLTLITQNGVINHTVIKE